MANPRGQSPLRYPGGKACLTNFITELATLNDLNGGTYLELYAGGAGAALNMLFNGIFSHIHINDFDYRIYAMWDAILHHTDDFIKLVENTDVTLEEWHRQKAIYEQIEEQEILTLGFATFFLNRTNRSGIIFRAGPIGGLKQEGNYLIDVRFNKKDLIQRIEKIGQYQQQINLTQLDAIDILINLEQHHPNTDQLFTYLDPPYYHKGGQLYLNNYKHDDHLRLATTVAALDNRIKWLISYDNVPEIRNMYNNYRMSSFNLNYVLQSKKFGSELLVFSPELEVTEKITVNSRVSDLTLLTRTEDEAAHLIS